MPVVGTARPPADAGGRAARGARQALRRRSASRPARYRDGRKWSGVGAACRKSGWASSAAISVGSPSIRSLTASSKRCGQSCRRRPAAGPSRPGRGRHCRSRRPARRARAEAVEALVGVDGQLDDRDGGVREGVHQHAPGAVVDAPRVDVRAHPGRGDDVTDLLRQLRQAGRRVVDVEQLLREAVEVVIVRGCGIAVTAVAPSYQCADTTRTAGGRGSTCPNARHALVQW